MNHEIYIKECFELAIKAQGMVSPNPLVGAVLVKNGNIIGRGYHRYSGSDHAEIAAIKDAEKNGHDVSGASLYCNLAPCCHTNKKTPPCTETIINKNIAEVIVSNDDPNPEVFSKGIEVLERANIKVVVGVLKDQGEELNEVFFYNMRHNLPYIHIKWAQTLDGKIATQSFDSKWITNETSRKKAHEFRLKYDAVAVGYNTVLKDDPELTIRMGVKNNKKVPKRIIFSNSRGLELNKKIFSDQYKDYTYLVTTSPRSSWPSTQTIEGDFFSNPNEVFKKIYKEGIRSLLVEGGAKLISYFLVKRMYQKVSIFIAPKILGPGIEVPQWDALTQMKLAHNLKILNIQECDGDIQVDLVKGE